MFIPDINLLETHPTSRAIDTLEGAKGQESDKWESDAFSRDFGTSSYMELFVRADGQVWRRHRWFVVSGLVALLARCRVALNGPPSTEWQAKATQTESAAAEGKTRKHEKR